MDRERLRLATDRILALPAEDRPAAIAAEAAGDAQLAEALERAVREETVVGPGVQSPESSRQTGGPASPRLQSLVPNEEVADGSLRYRLVRRLPGGGLGEVWVAEQTAPVRRRVAMKFIRDDRITQATLDRFENERRLLASFDHPNIARYYHDGLHGTRPWFAMEFVEGDTIDEYCQRNRLSVIERIRLVQQVARAVQYAHDREVVHRDLKPHNVIVSNDGVPKLLDFGIAKILKSNFEGPRGVTSDFEPRTDEYASPEQLENKSSTTRSDVYALGVLLYELLTDQLPYHVRTRVREAILELKKRDPPPPMSEALDEVEDDADATAVKPEAASGGPPTPLPPGSSGSGASGDRRRRSRSGRGRQPSRRLTEIARSRGTRPDRLIRQLQGNLDNIVLKAMRIEPLRRYDSPEALAADLENHLQGLPVVALPESAAARLSRALVRNRWVVVGGMLALTAAVGVLLASTFAYRNQVLESERARIETQRAVLRAGFDRVMRQADEEASRITRDSGDILRLTETLRQMEADYTVLSEAGGDDAAAVRDWIETGELRRRLAVLADSPANRASNAGRPDEADAWVSRAEEAVQRSTQISQDLGEGVPPDALRLSALLARERGDAAKHRTLDLAAAEESYRRAVSMLDQAIAAVGSGSPDLPFLRRERLMLSTKLADIDDELGRRDGLLAAREQVVSGYRAELARSDSAGARVDLSIGLLRLGEAMEAVQGASDASVQCFEDAVGTLRPALDARARAEVRRAAVEALIYLADRLLVRADRKARKERDEEDRRRAGELFVEAAQHAGVLAFRAPEEMRSREDLLRIHQLLLPSVPHAWALRGLESVRVVRIEPDRWMQLDGAWLPSETADLMSAPASRALRIAYGNRLAQQWDSAREANPPVEPPDPARVALAIRDSLELARTVASGTETDLSLIVESMCCLALAADPDVAAILWPSEPERTARASDSAALARGLRKRLEGRERELASGAIRVAHWFASARLDLLEPRQAAPGPSQ